MLGRGIYRTVLISYQQPTTQRMNLILFIPLMTTFVGNPLVDGQLRENLSERQIQENLNELPKHSCKCIISQDIHKDLRKQHPKSCKWSKSCEQPYFECCHIRSHHQKIEMALSSCSNFWVHILQP